MRSRSLPGLIGLLIVSLYLVEDKLNLTECLSSEFPTQNHISGQQNLEVMCSYLLACI